MEMKVPWSRAFLAARSSFPVWMIPASVFCHAVVICSAQSWTGLRFDCSTVETQTCVIYARAALRELGWEVRKKAA
jgi:hypothetical protein